MCDQASQPTPSYTHLTCGDFDQIYEPCEDTFLLLDSLEKDKDLINAKRPLVSLEVGPGSGIVITFLRKLFKKPCFCLASDINSHAALSTKRTAEENDETVQVTVDSLAECFFPRLERKVDVLLFNPPYVVTPSDEVGGRDLSASWAGGIDGREVIDRFLPRAIRFLSAEGLFYLVVLDQNKPEEITKKMKDHGFNCEVVIARKAGREQLSVLRFTATK